MLEFVYLEECSQEKLFSKHIAAQTHSDGQNSKLFCLGPFKKLDSYSVLNFYCSQAFKNYPFWVITQFSNSSFPPTLCPYFRNAIICSPVGLILIFHLAKRSLRLSIIVTLLVVGFKRITPRRIRIMKMCQCYQLCRQIAFSNSFELATLIYLNILKHASFQNAR